MDETYLKAKGKWFHFCRTVDKEGSRVDFTLSEHIDKPAARAFFDKVIGASGIPI